MPRTRRAALALHALVLVVLAATGWAQAPKAGDTYPRPDLGFQVKTPDDWPLIPPQPNDPHLIAKFSPPINKYVITGPGQYDRVFLSCWIVQFDRRKKADAEKPKFAARQLKDLTEWVQKADEVEFGGKHKLVGTKPFTAKGKIAAVEHQYATPDEDEKQQKRVYAVVYTLAPDFDVALVFTGPGAKSKWPKYETAFETMARSFAPMDVVTSTSTVAADAPLRVREKDRLTKDLAKLGGGWKLYETPNYFVVTPHEDRAFVQELCDRLEAIRKVYEVDYPYEVAAELRKVGEAAQTGLTAEEKKEKEREKEFMKELFGGADPRELSRCSVVRVFADSGQYRDYGGRPNTAGYWSAFHRELVVFDDQADGGRRDTWITLNHEAFHQYIFYLYGNISPHSWYNEGTGDFYSGYEYKNKQFTLKPNQWRIGTIKEAVQGKKHVPLAEFVKFTQAEYYGQNKYGIDGGQNYAQGWSFIYFLRTGKKNFQRNWDPTWESILPTYFRVLATSGDLDQAVHEAFQGIDMTALEEAWKAST